MKKRFKCFGLLIMFMGLSSCEIQFVFGTPNSFDSNIPSTVSPNSSFESSNSEVSNETSINDGSIHTSASDSQEKTSTSTFQSLESIEIYASKYELYLDEIADLYCMTYPNGYENFIEYEIINDESYVGYIERNIFYPVSKGTCHIIGKYQNIVSNTIELIILEKEIIEDPYINMSNEEFYSNYKPATSYLDSYYRSLHNFMSGSISDQDQEPTISKNQPMKNGRFIKNSSAYFSDDGNTYYILNYKGEIVNEIYKGGAYIALEEVAAYIYAFGDVPINYISSNSANVSDYPWGKYLRLNHSYFSGNTTRYPYEPALPRIKGINNGDLGYYEVDIGTTGTDCDPNYSPRIYNDGYRITRGAARIVYSRYYNNYSNMPVDISDRYVFYTYNHYNDFQEYLNYENGWGEMFGNITGGGEISSTTNYNPTPYVEIVKENFLNYYKNLKYFYLNKETK